MSLDVFFMLGGTLSVYTLMSKFERQTLKGFGIFWLPIIYLLRWVRLIGPLALVLFFTMYIVPYVGQGPNWGNILEAQSLQLTGKLGCYETWVRKSQIESGV